MLFSYYYRTYALRRVRDGFHQHKSETNPEKIESLKKYAEENLEIIRRQVTHIYMQFYLNYHLQTSA